MKAITVRQPYAWAIANGGKTVENRGSGTEYQGPILIHAGRAWSREGGGDRRVLAAFRKFLAPHQRQDAIDPAVHPDRFEFGAVIAVADLDHVHLVARMGCCPPWGERWHAGPRSTRRAVHLVLTNVRPLPEPVAARGALGLWTPPAEVVRAAMEQLEVAA